MALKYGQISDNLLEDNTYGFRLGHVERVFTSQNDVQLIKDVKTEPFQIDLNQETLQWIFLVKV